MKERELRRFADCSWCGKPIGHTGLPVFSRVTVERIGIKIDSVQRQSALAVALGSVGLAEIMGPNEDMTESLGGITTLSICETCYVAPVRIAALAEMKDVLE